MIYDWIFLNAKLKKKILSLVYRYYLDVIILNDKYISYAKILFFPIFILLISISFGSFWIIFVIAEFCNKSMKNYKKKLNCLLIWLIVNALCNINKLLDTWLRYNCQYYVHHQLIVIFECQFINCVTVFSFIPRSVH